MPREDSTATVAASWAFAFGLLACGTAPEVRLPLPTNTGGDTYRIDMFDVGTGLSILVSGRDFKMLYDGGSNDDLALGEDNRLLAYLADALGPPGSAACPISSGRVEGERIDHLFLSHPHRDHLAYLPEVIACYDVRNIYDSAFGQTSRGYAAFLAASEAEVGAKRYIPSRNPRDKNARWIGFDVPSTIPLGRGATAKILLANAFASDANDASIIVRVDLGKRSLLLTGDATAGKRAKPYLPPSEGSPEGRLVREHAADIDVDILQVAHHGSMTSTRHAFLEAVSPRYALLSAGPRPYGDVILPDSEVLAALRDSQCEVLRTDWNDARCGDSESKVGPDQDGRPGGCTAYSLSIDEKGNIAVRLQDPSYEDKGPGFR
jgi:beta-lactamase superfamily II metal-dependent hydrolase